MTANELAVYNQLLKELKRLKVAVIIDSQSNLIGEYNALLNLIRLDQHDVYTLAHECVHVIQSKVSKWIGEQPLTHYNSNLTPQQCELLGEFLSSYPQEDLKWEIPAWALQEDPRKVLTELRKVKK
jgi:predicted transposase YbfD/YdcC